VEFSFWDALASLFFPLLTAGLVMLAVVAIFELIDRLLSE
jgi:hypothetical protein